MSGSEIIEQREEPSPGTPAKPLHPMPAFCRAWVIGGVFLLLISGLILSVWLHPSAKMLEQVPRDHPRWTELLLIGVLGVLTGAGYGWMWYRFARRQILNRTTWHIGTALLLSGATFLILTGWLFAGIVYLLTFAIWAQGLTRKHFDWK